MECYFHHELQQTPLAFNYTKSSIKLQHLQYLVVLRPILKPPCALYKTRIHPQKPVLFCSEQVELELSTTGGTIISLFSITNEEIIEGQVSRIYIFKTQMNQTSTRIWYFQIRNPDKTYLALQNSSFYKSCINMQETSKTFEFFFKCTIFLEPQDKD